MIVPTKRRLSKIEMEMRDWALMMKATGIIQHAPTAWSSYSSVVAMAKQIPLFSTWMQQPNVLTDFEAVGGCPKELTGYHNSNVDSVMAILLSQT